MASNPFQFDNTPIRAKQKKSRRSLWLDRLAVAVAVVFGVAAVGYTASRLIGRDKSPSGSPTLTERSIRDQNLGRDMPAIRDAFGPAFQASFDGSGGFSVLVYRHVHVARHDGTTKPSEVTFFGRGDRCVQIDITDDRPWQSDIEKR